MKMARIHPACFTLVFLAVWANERPVCGQPSAEDVLAVLRAKDSQFENVNLKYTVTKPYSFGGMDDEGVWSVSGTSIYHEQMVMRGPDVTIVQNLDPSLMDGPLSRFMVKSSKNGLTKDFHIVGTRGNEGCLIIRPIDVAVNAVQRQGMDREFALGFGFGKRIKEIHTVDEKDGKLIVTGSIQMWSRDESHFEAELDADYIVRSATVESVVGEDKTRKTRFETHTSGTVIKGPVALPETGTFKMTRVSGDKEELRTILDVEFRDVEFNLDDETYEQLTNIELPPGTQVDDHASGITYRVKENGEIETLWVRRKE